MVVGFVVCGRSGKVRGKQNTNQEKCTTHTHTHKHTRDGSGSFAITFISPLHCTTIHPGTVLLCFSFFFLCSFLLLPRNSLREPTSGRRLILLPSGYFFGIGGRRSFGGRSSERTVYRLPWIFLGAFYFAVPFVGNLYPRSEPAGFRLFADWCGHCTFLIAEKTRIARSSRFKHSCVKTN